MADDYALLYGGTGHAAQPAGAMNDFCDEDDEDLFLNASRKGLKKDVVVLGVNASSGRAVHSALHGPGKAASSSGRQASVDSSVAEDAPTAGGNGILGFLGFGGSKKPRRSIFGLARTNSTLSTDQENTSFHGTSSAMQDDNGFYEVGVGRVSRMRCLRSAGGVEQPKRALIGLPELPSALRAAAIDLVRAKK